MKKKKGSCGRPDCSCERKSRAFGAATWFVVLAAVAVVGAALWFSIKQAPGPKALASQAAASQWHPEPGFLLQHEAELQLDPRQRRHVQIVMREWDIAKAGFDARLRTYNSDSAQAMKDVSARKQPGGDYGKLLADFDQARNKAWMNATATLAPEQIVTLDSLREHTLAAKR